MYHGHEYEVERERRERRTRDGRQTDEQRDKQMDDKRCEQLTLKKRMRELATGVRLRTRKLVLVPRVGAPCGPELSISFIGV